MSRHDFPDPFELMSTTYILCMISIMYILIENIQKLCFILTGKATKGKHATKEAAREG